MKAEVETKPANPSSSNFAEHEPYFIIRLYPENLKEVSQIECSRDIGFIVEDFIRTNLNREINYAVTFKRKK